VEVAQAARVARPAWVNLRTVLGVILFSLALLGGNRLLAASKTTVDVWVATRDLPRDSLIAAGDVEAEAVKLPSRLLAAYAPATETLVGRVVTRPLHAGELVARGWLATSAAPSGARSLTVPVEPEHAVGGALRAGDRVDVLATFDAGDVRARTTLLARGVDVLEVVKAGALAFGDEAVVGVTLSVTPQEATRLAFALRTGEIDVVRVDGPAAGGASTVTSRDFP
jgi:pilus assembly protein CpaB